MLSYLPPLLPSQQSLPDLFDIVEVDSYWTRRAFAAVPWLVYRDDPYWTPPVLADRRRAIDLAHRETGPSDLGLICAESRSLTASNPVTGSLAVWAADENGTAAFGMFETINKPALAEALFEHGETWLFEHVGWVSTIRGPLGLQPLRLPGLLVDGFGERPGGLLPYNPPYYPDIVTSAGYEPAAEWVSYAVNLAGRAGGVGPQGSLGQRSALAGLAALYRTCDEALLPGLANIVEAFAAAGEVTTEDLSRQGRWLVDRLLDRALPVLADSGGCLALPDPGACLHWSRGTLIPFGWAAAAVALARTRQVHVYPAVAEHGDAEGMQAAYTSVFAAAARCGYQSAVVAPIPADDAMSAEVLTGFGARASHRFAVFERTF